jgi:large subunit ribosomal protein L13
LSSRSPRSRFAAMAHKLKGGVSTIRNVVTEGLRYRLVDARGEVVGRLASKLSLLLQGKDKPTYDPSISDGDVVVVVNAADITLTGRKLEKKLYYRHTGYVGGLVTRTAGDMMRDEPTFVLRKAVERMLPKNNLRKVMMRKLRLFPNEAHAFESGEGLETPEIKMVPFEMPPRILRKKKVPETAFPPGFSPFNPARHELNKKLAEKSDAAKTAFEARTGK